MIDLGSSVSRISSLSEKPVYVYPNYNKQAIEPIQKIQKNADEPAKFNTDNWDDFQSGNKSFSGSGNFVELFA